MSSSYLRLFCELFSCMYYVGGRPSPFPSTSALHPQYLYTYLMHPRRPARLFCPQTSAPSPSTPLSIFKHPRRPPPSFPHLSSTIHPQSHHPWHTIPYLHRLTLLSSPHRTRKLPLPVPHRPSRPHPRHGRLGRLQAGASAGEPPGAPRSRV